MLLICLLLIADIAASLPRHDYACCLPLLLLLATPLYYAISAVTHMLIIKALDTLHYFRRYYLRCFDYIRCAYFDDTRYACCCFTLYAYTPLLPTYLPFAIS